MTWNTKSFEEVLEKWSRDEVGPEPRAIEHPDYPDIILYLVVGEDTYDNEEVDEEIREELWARADSDRAGRMWDE